MACPGMEERLVDLLFDALGDGEASEVRTHLTTCPACRALHDELRSVTGDLRPAAGVTAPAGFEEAVRAGVLREIAAGAAGKLEEVGRCALLVGLGLTAITVLALMDWGWVPDLLQLTWTLLRSVVTGAALIVATVVRALAPAVRVLLSEAGGTALAATGAAYLAATMISVVLILLLKGRVSPVSADDGAAL